MGIIYPFKDSSDTKTLEKPAVLMWIQVIIAILSVYIILSSRSVTKKNSYWVRPAIRQMLGNRVQWKYKKKPIGHMSTFIRISSADINDWSNAIRRQKRPTWSQYWYSLHVSGHEIGRKGADENWFVWLGSGFMYFMCSKLNAIWLSVQRNSCAEWYPNMKDDIVDEYFQQPE